MVAKEAKEIEELQSINDNTQVLGYDKAGNKYGWIQVGKISSSDWCGCRWRKDSLTTVGEPVGSIPKTEKMAELFGLGGYLVQNNHSRRKLSTSTHLQFASGGTAKLDGTMGHYQWGSGTNIYYATWEDDTYEYEAIDTKPIPGQMNIRVPVFSRSCAGYATIDRTENRLVSYINSDTRYRGGNNDAAKDGAYNSMLGLPATYIGVPTAATYARKNGSLWFCNERVVFAITAVIMRIYYHDRDIQAHLGIGCTCIGDWGENWGYYPYIPLSAGVGKGDYTGTFSVNVNNKTVATDIAGIPSFFGLKNFYKYLGCIEEDMLLSSNPDKTQSVYIEHNIDGHIFDVTKTDGKVLMGNTPTYGAAGWTYIKKEHLASLCNFPLEIGASQNTGYADGYYNPHATEGLRGPACLGLANRDALAGSLYFTGSLAPSTATASYGVVLCEFREAFSTEPTLIT